MNLIENIAGELCRILLPIEDEMFFGNPKSNIAICTLSSMSLLKDISKSSIIKEVAIAGRLLSENKGIDSLVRSVILNEKIDTIILCGKDTLGHKPGDSLLCLYKNGINADQKIIGSSSPHPILTVTKKQVSKFQVQVKIINKVGETSISQLKTMIETMR
ncbi:tetrahydromethanopterin S-methyltransferase subunit A [Candidatus Nitrosotalea okcheonensis]|uniref:Tetrahydromethanopterin S-methyltransferase 23 kD subunit n=1 Tax=Candidatus Nitrosotalea okcheonensis TaxID=1903276 RepID=A0A2H1FGZ0_9ARCH|nr:tetrahydromethanopterin S-methyltransferase subunit A [Candidatus Nitrosotalea okcheonensis]SMH72035.1 Tetrahydromethanopterin S-methyltransferase 23 kD subunit [Candidatus Nitrosotalea okcheonensis]